jgi:hypothetical protein
MSTIRSSRACDQRPAVAPASLQAQFVERILPAVERHANFYFRHVKCRDRRADCVTEAVDLAWAWFLALTQRGKDATSFPSAIATFAARAVNSGRRLCGQEKTKDALSPLAQRRRGFTVSTLPQFETLSGNPLMDALTDNSVSPVPDQVGAIR